MSAFGSFITIASLTEFTTFVQIGADDYTLALAGSYGLSNAVSYL